MSPFVEAMQNAEKVQHLDLASHKHGLQTHGQDAFE